MATQEANHDDPPGPSAAHSTPISPISSFAKCRFNQNASRLMFLPAEIRLTILRELLRHHLALSVNKSHAERILGGPKSAAEDSLSEMSTTEYMRSLHSFVVHKLPSQSRSESLFQLWPAIMSTCQDVYAEAYKTLYNENRVLMTIGIDYCP